MHLTILILVLRRLICSVCENKYIQVSNSTSPNCWGEPIKNNDDPKNINWKDFVDNNQHHPDLANITEIFRKSIMKAYPDLDIIEKLEKLSLGSVRRAKVDFSQFVSQNKDGNMTGDFRFNNWDFFNKTKFQAKITIDGSHEDFADKILANISNDPHFRIQKNVSSTRSYLDVYLYNSTRNSCEPCDLCDDLNPDFLSTRLAEKNTDLEYLPWHTGTTRTLPKDKKGKKTLLTKDIPEILKHYKDKR